MKFILTSELGRLCRWLRILGYDAYYFRGSQSSLVIRALQEGRTIVTRRRKIAEEKVLSKVVLRSERLGEQLNELEEKLGIKFNLNGLFARCSFCNQEVVEVEKDKVKDKVPEYVYQTQKNFFKCPKCKRIFWQGTHWDLARKYFQEIKR